LISSMNLLKTNRGPRFWRTKTESSYTKFHDTFTRHYDSCFPYKPPSTPYKSNLPWLSVGIKKSIITKNKLYNKQLKRHTPANVTAYKTFRNKLNHLIRLKQRQYYQDQLEQNKTNLRKSWSIINTVINRNKKARLKTESLNINGVKSSDPAEIANFFNHYFTNVGLALDKKIPKPTTDPLSYIPSQNINSIFLNPCSKDEITQIITKLKTCANGWDDISATIIK
jgi:hypothetical protein